MIALTKSCAVDLAPRGIRVNCVCPGTTATPLVDTAVARAPDPAAARRRARIDPPARPARDVGRDRLGDPLSRQRRRGLRYRRGAQRRRRLHRTVAKMSEPAPLLRLEGIDKRFPGVRALHGISLRSPARRGPCPPRRERRREVDADEDPSGEYTPDGGRMFVRGEEVVGARTRPRRSASASASSIRSSASALLLSVAENIFLGHRHAGPSAGSTGGGHAGGGACAVRAGVAIEPRTEVRTSGGRGTAARRDRPRARARPRSCFSTSRPRHCPTLERCAALRGRAPAQAARASASSTSRITLPKCR